MRSRARQKAQRGIALVLVLIVLTVLGVMTADFMESNEVNLAATVNARDSVRGEFLARSGVNLGRLLLSLKPLMGGSFDSMVLPYSDLIIGMFVDPAGGSLITDMMGLNFENVEGIGLGMDPDYESLEVKIVDEDSKINVNVGIADGRNRERMVQQLTMLMAPMAYDEMFDRTPKAGRRSFLREDIICELIDWADPDETRCDGSGGEDPSVYQEEDPPYERKNAPFNSLQELHQVAGIGDDFWSAFVEPDVTSPESRVMTVWGKGKVNVNTAPAQVLFTIVCMMASDPSTGVSLCMDPTQQLNVLQILQAAVMLRTFMPFGKVSEFTAAIENPETRLFVQLPGIPLPNKGMARRALSTSSTVFSIFATAKVGRVSKRIHVVIDTEGQDMIDPTQSVAASGGKVLYWRME